jgi:hypothetical protein
MRDSVRAFGFAQFALLPCRVPESTPVERHSATFEIFERRPSSGWGVQRHECVHIDVEVGRGGVSTLPDANFYEVRGILQVFECSAALPLSSRGLESTEFQPVSQP